MSDQKPWKDIAQRVAMFGEAGKKTDRAAAMLAASLTNRPICSPGQAHLDLAMGLLHGLLKFDWIGDWMVSVRASQAGVDDWRAKAYERISCAAEQMEARQKSTLEKIGGFGL